MKGFYVQYRGVDSYFLVFSDDTEEGPLTYKEVLRAFNDWCHWAEVSDAYKLG